MEETPLITNNEPTAPIIVPLEPTKDDTFVQIQNTVNFVPYQHCCGCNRSPNLIGFFFNFLIWLATIFILTCLLLHLPFMDEFNQSPFGQLIHPLFFSFELHVYAIVYPVVYLVYLIDVFCTNSCKYLFNMDIVEDFVGYVERIKQIGPAVGWGCECYHYETRTRTVYYTDSNGNRQSRTETYTEKVVTHSENEYFRYTRFDDVSGSVTTDILVFIATKVKFTKSWDLGDERTRQLYNVQESNFISRNKYRDTHFNSWNLFNIDGFVDRKLCLVELNKRNAAMSYGHYLMYSLLLLCSWPYRIWLENKTVRSRFHFTKVLYCY